jgi:hypothetical protein
MRLLALADEVIEVCRQKSSASPKEEALAATSG